MSHEPEAVHSTVAGGTSGQTEDVDESQQELVDQDASDVEDDADHDDAEDSDDDDDEDGDGEDQDGDDDEEEDKDQPQVESLVAGREKRRNAGNRMAAALLQQGPADADDEEVEQQFQDIFAEGLDDDEFADQDAVADGGDDDDDDDSSASDPDDKPEDELAGEKELASQERAAKTAQKRKAPHGIPIPRRKQVKIQAPAADEDDEARRKRRKKSDRRSWALTDADQPTRVSSRTLSVQNKSRTLASIKESSKRAQVTREKMRISEARKKAMEKPPMTQEDRLAEAARVEKINKKSVHRWEEQEQERQERQRAELERLRNKKLEGPVIRWYTGPAEFVPNVGKDAGGFRVRTLGRHKPKLPVDDAEAKQGEHVVKDGDGAPLDASTDQGQPDPADTNKSQVDSIAVDQGQTDSADVEQSHADLADAKKSQTNLADAEQGHGADAATEPPKPAEDVVMQDVSEETLSKDAVEPSRPPSLPGESEAKTGPSKPVSPEQHHAAAPPGLTTDGALGSSDVDFLAGIEDYAALESSQATAQSQSQHPTATQDEPKVEPVTTDAPLSEPSAAVPRLAEADPETHDDAAEDTSATSILASFAPRSGAAAASAPAAQHRLSSILSGPSNPTKPPKPNTDAPRAPTPEPHTGQAQSITLVNYSESLHKHPDALGRIIFGPTYAPPVKAKAASLKTKRAPTECAVTGHTAKYRDPVTGLGFASVKAYGMIRALVDGLAASDNAKDAKPIRWSPLLNAWIGKEGVAAMGVPPGFVHGTVAVPAAAAVTPAAAAPAGEQQAQAAATSAPAPASQPPPDSTPDVRIKAEGPGA